VRAATSRWTQRATLRTTLPSALLLCAVTACGAGGERAAGPDPTTATTSSSTSASSTTSAPGGRMTVGLTSPVLLERSGGIAGRHDRIEVRPDGTYTVSTLGSRPVTRQLSEAELAAVVAAVKAANLRAVRPEPPATGAQADMFRYKLVAEGEAVTTTDEQADGGVRRLINVLMPLFSAPAPTP
jgi:hypothetical protein